VAAADGTTGVDDAALAVVVAGVLPTVDVGSVTMGSATVVPLDAEVAVGLSQG